MTEEHKRLAAARALEAPWRKWGPYLSERQWGTVREDYGPTGDAWNYLSHDLARSHAFRWGEDGIAGFCDDQQILCVGVALWNGKDPILKERLFGLTNSEGNHGEDVKEYYYYLDATPTHSYMRYLYKYPQRAFPYLDLVETNRSRSRADHEYELIDTGVFDDDRYFDVFVDYAKASPDDLLIEIQAYNRGPDAAPLHILPTFWFRNVWAHADARRPALSCKRADRTIIDVTSEALGNYSVVCERGAELLFADNETNPVRARGVRPVVDREHPYFKDGINNYLVLGDQSAVNPKRVGTKAAAHYHLHIPAGASQSVRLRLRPRNGRNGDGAGAGAADRQQALLAADFTTTLAARRREADEFYAAIIPQSLSEDDRRIARQASAGMLWSKQFYSYDVDAWLAEHGASHGHASRHRNGAGDVSRRNDQWQHMVGDDIISMPDKWEYPWYAAWDLAFHSIPLGLVDPDFAKQQLLLLLQERYLHPNGQVPAYEWNFSDVNPPVHAWAAYFLYQQEKQRTGKGDVAFLKSVYQKLLLNFTWWINRKDPAGRNVFEGGFLGLDNIGVFDRSATLPSGGHLEQADGTAWMAFYAQMMLQISLELALADPSYADMALKFFEHFIWIASAMVHIGGQGAMWNDEDGFFYDVVRTPDRPDRQLKVRSMVGLLPLCAVAVIDERVMAQLPELQRRAGWFARHRPHLVSNIHDPRRPGFRDRRMLSLLNEDRLRRVLARMLDENEFLSPFGIRSLSRYHLDHPCEFELGGERLGVGYLPAESDTGMFSGNSNWRGPVWLPVNGLLIRALLNYFGYFGPTFKVECPTGSGRRMTLYEVARNISERVAKIFRADQGGRRPVFGGARKFSDDPLWRDQLLFYEYFHGDNGAGIGASHQTGWTGLVAPLMHYFATVPPAQALELWSPLAPPVTRKKRAPGSGRPEAGRSR